MWVNLEPCIQCASALGQLGFVKIYFGAANDRFGGCGSVLDVAAISNANVQPFKLTGGFQSERAINLLKEFYRGENPNAPNPKPKIGRK